MGLDASVTVVVTRAVLSGREREYEEWVGGVAAAAHAFPGHLGLLSLPPQAEKRERTLVFRFETEEQLQAWERSEVRREWLLRAEKLCEPEVGVRKVTGLETWFALPGGGTVAPPPRWKMVMVSFGVAFPTIQGLNATIGAWLSPLHPLMRGAAVGLSMVLFMTYAAMPLATKILKGWLYPPKE